MSNSLDIMMSTGIQAPGRRQGCISITSDYLCKKYFHPNPESNIFGVLGSFGAQWTNTSPQKDSYLLWFGD